MPESVALPVGLVVVGWLLACLPFVAVGLLAWWTRWLGHTPRIPRYVLWVARGFVLVSAACLLWGLASGAGSMVAGRHLDGSRRAASLGMGLSEAVNDAAFAVLVAFVGAFWLAVSTWRWRPVARKWIGLGAAPFLLLLFVVTGGSRLLHPAGGDKRNDTAESYMTLGLIRSAQNEYLLKNGHYANVSVALGANTATNHAALYPQVGREPGKDAIPWGGPCPPTACNPGMDWSMLGVRVTEPQKYGFSTIAGRAGERPTAIVTVQGQPLDWPVPDKDWFIISAVGDPKGDGRVTTLVQTSWETDTHLDQPAPKPGSW